MNGKGRQRWSRVCEVVVADRPRQLRVADGAEPALPRQHRSGPSTSSPVEGGTRIVQRFEVLQLNWIFDRLFYALIPAHRDRTAALTGDLESLGQVAHTEVQGGAQAGVQPEG